MHLIFKSFLYLPLASSLLTGAGIPVDKQLNDEASQSLPTFKVLPAGSTLTKVRIPQFDADYHTESLLIADTLHVVNKSEILGKNVTITLYQKGKPHANAKLTEVTYNQNSSHLTTRHPVQISGESYAIHSNGLLLDWNSRSGFLLGKSRTTFYSDSTTMNKPSQPSSRTTKSSSNKKQAVATAAALAVIPPTLTADELKAIDQLAAPSTAQITQVDSLESTASKNINALSSAIDDDKNALAKRLGTTLIVAEGEAPLPPEPATEKPLLITITSDGGMYFDATKGHIVYYKNITVNHPQHKLTCDDELKIILKEKVDPTDKKDTTEKSDKEKSPIKFGDVDSAIATGNVVVTGKDSSGKPIKATAQIATYNHTSGIIILKGGRPTLSQGDTVARVLSDEGYIMIMPNMSIRINGRHEIKANTANLKSKNK